MENALNTKNGTTHAVQEISGGFALLCNKKFNLGVDGWFYGWQKTDRPPTCKHCRRERRQPTQDIGLEMQLTSLGQMMREMKTANLRRFLKLSKTCEFRAAHMYNWPCHKPKQYAFCCNNPKLEDPNFGWGCNPNNCPYIGRLSGSEWQYDIEEKPTKEEIEIYENTCRTKED
jgi:hypothetical protein